MEPAPGLPKWKQRKTTTTGVATPRQSPKVRRHFPTSSTSPSSSAIRSPLSPLFLLVLLLFAFRFRGCKKKKPGKQLGKKKRVGRRFIVYSSRWLHLLIWFLSLSLSLSLSLFFLVFSSSLSPPRYFVFLFLSSFPFRFRFLSPSASDVAMATIATPISRTRNAVLPGFYFRSCFIFFSFLFFFFWILLLSSSFFFVTEFHFSRLFFPISPSLCIFVLPSTLGSFLGFFFFFFFFKFDFFLRSAGGCNSTGTRTAGSENPVKPSKTQ